MAKLLALFTEVLAMRCSTVILSCLERPLSIWVHHNPAGHALLTHVGPSVPTRPLPFALWTLELTPHPLITLIFGLLCLAKVWHHYRIFRSSLEGSFWYCPLWVTTLVPFGTLVFWSTFWATWISFSFDVFLRSWDIPGISGTTPTYYMHRSCLYVCISKYCNLYCI